MTELTFCTDLPLILTPRLYLRAITHADAENYFSLCSHEDTMRAYGVRAHENLLQTKRVIDFLAQEFLAQRIIRFGIFLRDEDTLIGDCGFWQFDTRRRRAEAGVKLAHAYTKHGYMHEAFRALLTFAFGELKVLAVEGNCAVDNHASQRLLLRLGFVREGMRREFSYCAYDERFKDSILFSLLKRDFLESP